MLRSRSITEQDENSDNVVRNCRKCGEPIEPERRKSTDLCYKCSREEANERFDRKLAAKGLTRGDYNHKCKEKIREADPEGYKRKQNKWKQDSRDAKRRLQEAKAQKGAHAYDGAVGPTHVNGSGGAPALL